MQELHPPVGVGHGRRQMAGGGRGDLPGDGVVHDVQTGGAGDRRGLRGVLVLDVDVGHQLIQVAQQLVGGEVQRREVVHGDAQPAHRRRRVQAVSDHIADDQRHPGAGQRDDVEPVPAHSRLGGKIAVRHLQGILVGQATGHQAALERHRHRAFPGVAPGVVDAHRGPPRQFLGEGQVLFVERRGTSVPPELHPPQHHAPGAQGYDRQGMHPVVQDAPGALRVLGPPVGSAGQVRLHPGAALVHTPRRRGARGEAHQLADGVERMVRRQTGDGRPAHLRTRHGRLLALQDRVQQLDGDDVGEPGDRHLRQVLGGALDIQRGADPYPGVVEEPQPLPRHLGAPGQPPQLGGVAQGHHASLVGSVGAGGTLVEGQQPVLGQVHLVGGDPVRRQEFGGAVVQPQVADLAPLRVRRQVQEPPRLVIGQQQPAVAADDEDALAHRVQDRIVMLVHPGHLGRSQTVGLPAQPTAHQPRTASGECQGHDRGAQEDGQLLVDRLLHLLHRDRCGDDGDDPARGVLDGGRGDHGEAEGTLEGPGEGFAPGGVGIRADDVLADLPRVTVGEGDPVELVHDEGVDAGGPPGRLGERLELRGRIVAVQRLLEPPGVGEGLGGGEGAVPGIGHGVPSALDDDGHHRRRDEQHHEHQLEEEDFPGDAARGRRGPCAAQPTPETPRMSGHGSFLSCGAQVRARRAAGCGSGTGIPSRRHAESIRHPASGIRRTRSGKG